MPLEELEKELYKRTSEEEKTPSSQTFAGSGTDKKFARTGWSGEEKPEAEKKTSGFPKFLTNFSKTSRRLFWILVVVLLVLICLSAFYFYQYFTARDIAFYLKAPSNVMLGVPFDIEISIQNNFENSLKDIRLSMFLPEGAALFNGDVEKRSLTKNFGDLDKDGILQDKISVIIFGKEQSVKQFEVSASFFPPTMGPKARFEQTKSVEVTARSPGIKLDLTAPQKVLNNEDFEIEVSYQNISNIDFSGVELTLDYPSFFTFEDADPKPSLGNNIWKIGDLPKDSEKKVLIIKGSVISKEKTFFEIKGFLSVEFSGQEYLISEKAAELNIASSPLFLNITLNDKSDYLASLDKDLRYKITYRNNSDVGLNDVVIKAKLTGEMFNFQNLRSKGFFSSKDNTITWNVANTPELRVIAPGVEGFVEFETETKDEYPIKRLSDKNFTLKVEAEISSPTVPYYVAADKTLGLAELENKVAGNIVIGSQVFFRDSGSGIVNEGSLPPKVNVPTNFTIHWLIANYSTDVKNIEIRGYLQAGIRWANQVKSNVDALPTYNERTQEVVWKLDKIQATKGVISQPVEAIFQIEGTPNVTQVGQGLPLLSVTNLRAFDEFANVELINSATALNTQLISDPEFDATDALVIK